MNLERLAYFAAVARHMNFTRAAEECNIAQTAMSRQISMLEDEVGFPLFERNSRSVRFTPAGQVFYKSVDCMLDMYKHSLNQAKNISLGLSGNLHIGIGAYEHVFVSPLIEEFHKMHPSIDVRVSQYPYALLSEKFLSGALDIVFALPVSKEHFSNPGIKATPLFKSKVCVAMRKDHPLAGCTFFPEDGWRTETFATISEERGPTTIHNLYKWSAKDKLSFHQRPIQVIGLNAALTMVEAGLALLCVPDFLGSALSPQLKLLPILGVTAQNFWVFSHENSPNPAVSVFIDGIHSSDTLSKWDASRGLDNGS